MAVLYTPHFIQFLDDDGNPLSGGKLYTYAAGGTTPKATYTTAAATVENANPVILDADGRATVFISGSYRFDLYTSADVLIKSTDNVTSFDAAGSSGSINDFSGIATATPENDDLFIFSDDSDSGQSKTVTLGNLGVALGIRIPNSIINGSMRFWQRGTSFTSIATGSYSADRWRYTVAGAAVCDIARSATVPHVGVPYSLKIDCTTADASLAATDACFLEYRMGGLDAAKFYPGTALAKSVVLKFWVRSNKTGTYCVAVRNAAADKSYVAEYTIDSADTFEEKTVTLTIATDGTWITTTTALSLQLVWALSAGSNFIGAAGSWLATNTIATSNQVNFTDANTNELYLADVRFGIGDSDAEFEIEEYGSERRKALAYFSKTFPMATAPAAGTDVTEGALQGNAVGTGTGDLIVMWYFPVPMVAAPTITTYNPFDTGSGWRNAGDTVSIAALAALISEQSCSVSNNAAVTDAVNYLIHATASAEI